jgi:hypothetical protein
MSNEDVTARAAARFTTGEFMRFTRTTVAVAATAVGVLALGACDGNTGTSDAASSPPPVSAPPSGTTNQTSGGGDTKAATGPSTGSAGGTATATASGRCHAGDIGYSWATGGDAVPDPHSTEQQSAFVVLTNTSAHTCVLRGFPGVDLVNSGKQWSLIRDSQSPHTIPLVPGASTQVTVTFLPWSANGNVASNNFAPTTLVITLPNETKSYDLPWRWGHVLLQDAATHPGTYISPVGD